MRANWLLLLPLAVGHLALFVLIFNVLHALGLRERRANVVKLSGLAALALSSSVLAALAITREWNQWPTVVLGYGLICLVTALIGLPAVTFLRANRREPYAILERSELIDLAKDGGADAWIGTGRHAWMLRVRGNESLLLKKAEWRVDIPTLPPGWDALSVVHLTDLHFSPCYRREFFERVADEAAGWDADLVLFTGDLIDNTDALDWIVPVMSRVRGRLGNFAILGNHDFDHRPDNILLELERAGFTNLEGRWAELTIEGKTLAIGGTSYPWGVPLDLDAKNSADFRLLLSHTPDLFYRAASAGIDLMLSGHNHGGQIRFPGIGPVFMPSVYSRRFDRGYFQTGRTTLHVSQGVGGKHPLRFGCIPEIGRLVLRPCSETPDRGSQERLGVLDSRRDPRA